MSGIARHHSEWLSLIEVSGPFLTLPVLVRVFPQGLPKVDGKKLGRLRAAYEEWASAQDAKVSDAGALHAAWVRLVLGELLEFDDRTLRSADGLPSGLDVRLPEHHETLRPSIAIVEPSGRAKAGTPRLLVAIWPSNQDLESAVPGARWAASPLERMTQLCRSTGVRLGLVSNGERWTVVDAPVGQTAGYASWYAGLWLQEPITLAAIDALLGVRRFFAVADTDTLEAMLDESVAFQQEVTNQLGYQVRRAVEVLVQALDRADLDRKRELLRDVPPARLYDAALTVMMRLVFLFCAEERGLLLLGDETYDANYAVSTLRALLREEADRVGVEVLERRQDAWARLLATFRAVHGGVEHEALRLPALGGSLFDPDRFPFLEGRAAGTSWFATPASPLPIDNRTVLHLLEALQLLRTRGDGGTSEARKLSYRALDIEQIGHVYEGLLDHVAVRVDTNTLGLLGTKDKEPELSLDELNRERRHGTDGLIGFLKEHTGRSTSALRNDLNAELDEVAEQRLRVACGNDKALVKHIAPYHALIRKDVWGYPQIYRAGSFMVTGGPERRQTGTHYTPKSLTEQIVTETLEPLVYVGPAEGTARDAWKLRSAAELLDLKICDMAMGSGAFLVQVCRWLAERVVEAWEEVERQGAVISADGDILENAAGHDLLPPDREERLSFARRLVAERCVYGVDINPMAVELAKLSLWLITLAKSRPFGYLDHALKCGDSLLGATSISQLERFSLRPEFQQLTFATAELRRYVEQARQKRRELEDLPSYDHTQIETKNRLHAEAEAATAKVKALADCLIALELRGLDGDAYADARETEADQVQRLMKRDADANESQTPIFKSKDLREYANAQLRGRRPFHWPVEFPEVFARGGFDAFAGNPPFMGGTKLSTALGADYRELLVRAIAGGITGVRGSADLATYFLLRCEMLCQRQAVIGLVTTNSLGQGDAREVGFEQILKRGNRVIRAYPSSPWPGQATVFYAMFCLRIGDWKGDYWVDDVKVDGIDASLGASSSATLSPERLKSNEGVAFVGVNLGGEGFVTPNAWATALLKAKPHYGQALRPYLTGALVNGSPDLQPDDYIVTFYDWPLSRDGISRNYEGQVAEDFPECLEWAREHVKPYRDGLTKPTPWNNKLRTSWWQFGQWRWALEAAMVSVNRVLVLSRVTPHVMLESVGKEWVFSDRLTVFVTESNLVFATLLSSIHQAWAWRYGTTNLSILSYSPSECFLTLPLPVDAHGEVEKQITSTVESFVKARRNTAIRCQVGLTEIYNRFHDRGEASADIARLRALHVELDQAVAAAYGWHDLDLGHGFHPTKQGERYTLSEPARRTVLDRLLALNHQRYEEDVKGGLHDKKKPRTAGKKRPQTENNSVPGLFD